MSAAKTRILVVEDHFLPRYAIATLVNEEADLEVIAQAETGWQGVELYKRHKPDVVLMDLRLPEMDGVAATAAILRVDPAARVLIVSHYEAEEDVRRALDVGAKGYLKKDVKGAHLLEVIRKVAAGEQYVPPDIRDKLSDSNPRLALTKRELETLRLIFKGYSNQDIAQALNVSLGTVRIHVSNVLVKLGAKRRTEAVAVALKKGLVFSES